jgi:hypothetical protein
LVEDGHTLTWTSSGNTRSIKANKTLAFCPGAISEGIPQPYLIATGAINSPVCQSILISIANPRVFHSAIHSGSDTHKEFGLHIFPKSVLRLLETAPNVKWLTPLQLAPLANPGNGETPSLPKNLTIRFGAHRSSIYGAHSAKLPALSPAAKDPVRESYAREFIKRPTRPMILDAEFPEFQTLLDAMENEVPPITLPCITPLVPVQIQAPTPSTSGQKRRADKDTEAEADTGASGSGSHPASSQMAQPEGTNLQGKASATTQSETEEPYTREEALSAFIGSPRLPNADSLVMGHISAFMALRLGIGFISANRYISVFLKPHPICIGIPECQTNKSDTIEYRYRYRHATI